MLPKQSIIVTIDHQRYLLQATKASLPQDYLRKLSTKDRYIPTTAISWNESRFTDLDLEHTCRRYSAGDDVWSEHFLSFVILLQQKKAKCSVQSKATLVIDNSKAKLPAGPLFLERTSGCLFRVALLVPDTHSAFVCGVYSTTKSSSSFNELSANEEGIEIPLPSRLYTPTSESLPLAGVRVAVKDTIALEGLRTGYGNKAWLETYPPEKSTAPCIQRLIDAGAVIVGKTKTTEFAEGTDPLEWLDTICPYNPRGDGQQKPSSSSTGSAAAMAAYDWLDVTIGTDTGGSIRHPAGVNGLYGQRPTHGRVDLNGVLGATNLFNTVGIFARSAETFRNVGSHLIDSYGPRSTSCANRKHNLLYPIRAPRTGSSDPHHGGQHRWFPFPEDAQSNWSEAEKQIESVILQMEEHLNCTRIPFNINELWRATPVVGQSRSLDEAVGHVYSAITTYSALQTGIDKFRSDFAIKNDGQAPEISDIVKRRLDYGSNVSAEQIEGALGAMQAFAGWVQDILFGTYDQDATTILIFPQSCGQPDYRDVQPDRSQLFNDIFSIYAFGYLVGCPDYTVPVTEIPYVSDRTHKEEYLPVTISLVGRPGSDMELFEVVRNLHEKGSIRDVMAGRCMYPEHLNSEVALLK